MDSIAIAIRAAFTAFFAWVSIKFGVLVPVMGVLIFAMVLDFLTGWGASIINDQPITLRRGTIGIIKKVFYIVGVICGLFADWLIIILANAAGLNTGFTPMFGLLVAVWLILNEMVSILENLSRAGVHMPPFLIAVTKFLKIKVEKKGEIKDE